MDIYDESLISERIEQLMLEKKVTLSDMANQTGIARSTISSWFTRKTSPKSSQLPIVAKFLSTTPDYLLLGDEPLHYELDNQETELIEMFRAISPSSRKIVYDLAFNLKNHILK